ncbi:hypothetical protein ACIQ2D_09665 [Lysinibacillus sp. NPDC097287]|uniref:hypothetical protein n=1 Tax=Lysinibacillus sp. NPDC097287 TaxID=3364144 RepID=UPI0037FFFCD7
MFTIQTYLFNPEYDVDKMHLKKYILLDEVDFNDEAQSLYGIVKISDGQQTFTSSNEWMPQYWFIFLQVLNGAFRDGEDHWEFPSLLQMSLDGELITLQQDDEIFIFPAQPFAQAVANYLEGFIQVCPNYFSHTYPDNAVAVK